MKRIVLAIAAISMLAACSKNEVAQELEKGAMQSIKVCVAPFDGDNATKTAVTPGGKFTWSAGDKIGIYPVESTLGEEQTSQQIIFKINGTGDASSATFTGTGWGLITNGDYKYFSYYPYSADAEYNEATVTYYDNLNQVSNTSTAHLGVNDYLYAPQIQPVDEESAAFTFKHLSALVEFEITVPKDSISNKFIMLEVLAPSNVFTLSGKYDPSSATSTDAPSITENKYKKDINLMLNNGVGFTPDANGKIHAYFLIAPAEVSGKKLVISLVDEKGTRYRGTKTPTQDIESQNHKIYQVDVEPTIAKDLSVYGTANCYVVDESPETYTFLANIKGNGYDPFDATDHNENSSINLSGCEACVLWETKNINSVNENDIIYDVILDGNNVYFKTTGAKGNALISVKDSDGKIVWSWHIWVTNADLDNCTATYPSGTVFLDRNLGALDTLAGSELSIGLLYQWGRPSPFRSSYNFTTSFIETTNNNIWTTSTSQQSLQSSINDPTCFINSNTSNWASFDNTDMWGSIKTMYDPCPVGWKVPGNSDFGTITASDYTRRTVNNKEGFMYTESDPEVYYPVAGCIMNSDGKIGFAVSSHTSCFWTYNRNSYEQRSNLYLCTVAPIRLNNFCVAFGFNVRPCQDKAE